MELNTLQGVEAAFSDLGDRYRIYGRTPQILNDFGVNPSPPRLVSHGIISWLLEYMLKSTSLPVSSHE